MSSLEPTSPPSHIWVIENMATGEWLGTDSRKSLLEAEFGGRVPTFYRRLSDARHEWMRHSCNAGYIVRGVSLGGVGVRYERGPKFDFWPRIKFRKMAFVEEAFAVDTPSEMGIER